MPATNRHHAKRRNAMNETEIFDDHEGFLVEMEADVASFFEDLRRDGFRLPADDNREGRHHDDLAA